MYDKRKTMVLRKKLEKTYHLYLQPIKEIFFLLLFAATPVLVIAGDLKPFHSDGCSIFPDGTLKQNKLWLRCCVAHDRAYWIGGTENERLQADQTLKECVAGIGEPEIADVMLAGVRIGGSPYLPTSFRWGYGWPDARGYQPLSDEEKAQVEAENKRAAETPVSQIRLLTDIETLQNSRRSMQDTLNYMKAHPDIFPPKKLREKRVTTREQRLIIWQTWQAFLDRILVLDALQQRYSPHAGETDAAAASVGYAAFLAQYRFAMDFIDLMENDPAMHTVLNEEVPELGMKKERYTALKFRFLNLLKGLDFATRDLKKSLKDDEAHPLLAKEMEEDRKTIWQKGAAEGPKATAENTIKIIEESGFALYFPLQKEISEWMGDVKILRVKRSLIDKKQVDEIRALLQPGDIVLERREWYLSNIGLPGYWPHAALYIGTPQERRAFFGNGETKETKYGGDFDAYLQQHYPSAYKQSLVPHEEGHRSRVIEAISEGVSFTTLEHSVSADSVAILRPRLNRDQIATAIERAFHYSGRPYDFNFDFLTDSELVCTELVYKAYEPEAGYAGLRFPLQEIIGRKVTTANDMAQLFDAEYDRTDRQLDFVAFYDGYEWQNRAIRSDVHAFRDSWKRPKWYIWVQSSEKKQKTAFSIH